MNNVPKVNDVIYVPSSFYLSHGVDDFIGGKAIVQKVKDGISAGETVPFVVVKARPGTRYNWEELSEKQEELAQKFGGQWAHSDADTREEFNEDLIAKREVHRL